jgi:hypothetical protein
MATGRSIVVVNMSQPQLIWANKPGCSKAVAELWIGDSDLWFVIFVDDNDQRLKIELLPSRAEAATRVVDFVEIERLIETAKRELLALAAPSTPTS